MSTALTGPPILFLDLDGTVRHGHDELVAAGVPNEWVNGPDDVVVFGEAVVMMQRWRDAGGLIYGVTNQGGIAAGHMTEADCDAALRETDRQTGGLFTGFYACPHPVDGSCFCRKPLPGMLLAVVSEVADTHDDADRLRCLMVGDRPEDEDAATAAGVPFEWAATWRARAGDPA